MKHSILLLKTLLLSTSSWNILKHSRDSKKRKKIITAFIGRMILYLMLMGYSVATAIGFGYSGMTGAIPLMCAMVVSVLAFVFTLLRTNGHLFAFKEYDMLMSLPFSAKSVAGCKFLYMYIKTLPWYVSISVAMLIGYGINARPGVSAYLFWILLTFILPLIPMLAASFIGFLIARISAGFRKTNIVQTVLMFVFVIFCFSLRFFIEDLFANDKVEATLASAAQMLEDAATSYLPLKWFATAVTECSFLSALLLIAVSLVIFGVLFALVGRSYRNINSALKSHAAAKRFRMEGQKVRSAVNAIAFKEFKRLTGSTTYMVNGAMGEILAALLGIVTLLVGFEKIISFVTHGAPLDAAMLQPAIPFIVYFFIGMMATTVCSPSLEGKNYWIIESLPIEKKTLYQGKMLFNLYLTVPFSLFSTLCLCLSAKVSWGNTLLYLLLGAALCAFSTAWGCVCGIRHLRLDWENEVEVIKQSAGVAIYMLPNMFAVMGLCVLAVFLGTKLNHSLIAVIFIGIASLLAGLSYRRVMLVAK